MNKQTQWLFETPFASQSTPSANLGCYSSHPELKREVQESSHYSNPEYAAYDRYLHNQHLKMLQSQSRGKADPFVVETRWLKIPPGHETLNRRAASGLAISKTELDAMERGVRRVDTEKLSNHFKPDQQRRHMLRRYKCQRLEEALAEARQQLIVLHGKALSAARREISFEWIGEALHLIQDSYSPAHAERENGGIGAITFIRYYNIDGLPYPQEHRVFPMRQPGRLIPLPIDVRDYITHPSSAFAARAAIVVSREFLQMMLEHLGSPPTGYTAAQWATKRQKDLQRFMNKYLILSRHRTPTKKIYPSCP